ncbi:hypothetical protein ACFTWH_24225 [Streptomyces sp. NPDC057011]|uniref:hypothetical protein n=1 Tax=unclassified Streptomyces TaxID=2593676 RepID=UPI0036417744
MTPGPCSRAARAAMFAAVCVLLAATGHHLMTATALPWWAVAAAGACTTATAWGLAGRERGLPTVTAAAVAVQAALHAGFSLVQAAAQPSLPGVGSFAGRWGAYLACAGGPRTSMPAMPAMPSMPSMADTGAHAHAHHALHGMAATSPSGMGPADMSPGGMSPTGMLAAHLLAAVLAGLWLAYGEQAAFRILRALAGWLQAPLRPLFGLPRVPHRPHVRIRRARRNAGLRQLLLVHAITSRGPPTGTAVL